jgi:hypothetical protein
MNDIRFEIAQHREKQVISLHFEYSAEKNAWVKSLVSNESVRKVKSPLDDLS